MSNTSKNKVKVTVNYVTKTKEEVGIILAQELGKLCKQGRLNELVKVQ